MSGISGVGKIAAGLSGNIYTMAAASIVADKNVKVTNPYQCPKFNSTSVREITDKEFEKQLDTATETPQAKDDYTEELKKLRELLNAEIITQEEFDAKKKQLLGL